MCSLLSFVVCLLLLICHYQSGMLNSLSFCFYHCKKNNSELYLLERSQETVWDRFHIANGQALKTFLFFQTFFYFDSLLKRCKKKRFETYLITTNYAFARISPSRETNAALAYFLSILVHFVPPFSNQFYKKKDNMKLKVSRK